jgi:hypothetical protein
MKTKKAEGVFGLSFSMIFSIILIVFFIVAGFIAIRALMTNMDNMDIGSFFKELQTSIDDAWNSDSASFTFDYNLPSKIEYVCLINLSAPIKDANNNEKSIYSYLKETNYGSSDNLFIYSPEKQYDITKTKIKHIDISYKNPICFQTINKKVSIKIEKKFENPLVKVYYN